MKIINGKTNHLNNPIGFDMEHVVLSWSVKDARSKKQISARVCIALDESMKELVFDTGYKRELDNRGVDVDLVLNPYTIYYWQVEVMGEADEKAKSDIYWFETGKMQEKWDAKWIRVGWEDQTISPYMRKPFHVGNNLKKARLYIIGLGLYECEINGERVGNERLTPYCNAYDAWLQYQTYDVTKALKTGDNVLGVLLGNGWAKGRFGTFGDKNTPYIHEFALLGELRLEYEDGQIELIPTDRNWTCYPSPIVEDSIYDGEVYDANKEEVGWSIPEYKADHWRAVMEYTPKGLGPVVDRMSPPVVIKERIRPVEHIVTPKGEDVLDMGQNMVGWLRIKVNEPAGRKIEISFGEILQDDNFYRDNLREAKARYVYISDGKEAVIEPHFTFYGFRYAKLEGFSQPIEIDNFCGCVVYSDLDIIGNIETSNANVNRLFLNALWGQKGNFLDVPTDCPQRDERMGWTGDAEVFSGTACYNMDAYGFYTKFMRDLYEEQKFSDGMVASTVPTFSQIKYKDSGFSGAGACGWSDAATVIPWEVYIHTGDKTILKRQYQSMKDWVDWIIKKDKISGDRRLWTVGFHFGDWLALDGPVEGGVIGGTDNGLLASAYYRLSTNILAKTAKILGKHEDAEFYANRSEEVKRAIQDEYFTKNGRSTVDTQTARVVALHFDLVEEEAKKRVIEDLKALLKKSDMHLKTGFIGTPYLCRALSDGGASKEAYQIFMQEDYPSWLYEVLMGATTIWERWNSVMPDGKISGTDMNSLNHYAYGSIIEWVYRNVCGLKPIEEEPGFKRFIVSPEPEEYLTYAKATLQSPMGEIISGWKRLEDGQVAIEVKVPFNAEALLVVKGGLQESIRGIDEAKEVIYNEDQTKIVFESGTYTIHYIPKEAFSIL